MRDGQTRYRAHSDYTGFTLLLQDDDDHGAGADYTGPVPKGHPPPGLPAHVYTGKGYGMKAGLNRKTYGGVDPWLSGGRGGRGGGPSRG